MAIRVTRAGVGLAVGIIVVAGLVFGGLWLAKDRGEAARRDEAIKIADQKLQDETNQGVAAQNEVAKAEAEKKAAEEKARQEAAAKEKAAEDARQEAVAVVGELPQTGPVENTLALIAVAILAYVGVTYARSHVLSLSRNSSIQPTLIRHIC